MSNTSGSVLGAWQHERSQKCRTLFTSNKCLGVLNSNLKAEILLSILIGSKSNCLSVLFVSPQCRTVCVKYVRPGWTPSTGVM